MIKTSILILTHDAPGYVEKTLCTLNEITNRSDRDRCEVVVLDNASGTQTRELLSKLKAKGYIDRLEFSPVNTFFAKGNNLAAELASADSEFYLLLNSDVSIRDSDWLQKLFRYKDSKEGFTAAAYGMCSGPERADGYCFLVDRAVYDRFRLDENFQWWGAVTKLQCEMLEAGYSILAIDNHDKIIYHYGGKSGKDFKKAAQASVDSLEIVDCFRKYNERLVMVDHAPLNTFGVIRKKFRKLWALIKRL